MDCNQIRKQLKSFLGDLLLDEDHRLFLEHLDYCSNCKLYVRSIGDLSNQIWKLGKISVPVDFKSTVLFKLSHPETLMVEGAAKPSRGFQKKYRAVFLIAIFGLAVFALGVIFIKTQKPKRSPEVSFVPMQTRTNSPAPEDT